MTQILFTCQTLFISIRTLEYVRWGDAGFFGEEPTDVVNVDVDLNWDHVPIMLIWTEAYLVLDASASLIFDAAWELNRKVFNELIKLRGKIKEKKSHLVV